MAQVVARPAPRQQLVGQQGVGLEVAQDRGGQHEAGSERGGVAALERADQVRRAPGRRARALPAQAARSQSEAARSAGDSLCGESTSNRWHWSASAARAAGERSGSRFAGRSHTPSRSSAKRNVAMAARSSARRPAGRRAPRTTAIHQRPAQGSARAAVRLASWRCWRSTSGPLSRYQPSSASTSPAAAMRDSAVRTVPSAMPNSAPARTRRPTGSRGGRVPSSVDASTERVVSGGSDASSASASPTGSISAIVTSS